MGVNILFNILFIIYVFLLHRLNTIFNLVNLHVFFIFIPILYIIVNLWAKQTLANIFIYIPTFFIFFIVCIYWGYIFLEVYILPTSLTLFINKTFTLNNLNNLVDDFIFYIRFTYNIFFNIELPDEVFNDNLSDDESRGINSQNCELSTNNNDEKLNKINLKKNTEKYAISFDNNDDYKNSNKNT